MGTTRTIGAAVEDVLLGVSLRSLYLDYQMRALGIEDDLADRARALRRPLAQRRADDELHDQELGALVLTDLVDLNDVGV